MRRSPAHLQPARSPRRRCARPSVSRYAITLARSLAFGSCTGIDVPGTFDGRRGEELVESLVVPDQSGLRHRRRVGERRRDRRPCGRGLRPATVRSRSCRPRSCDTTSIGWRTPSFPAAASPAACACPRKRNAAASTGVARTTRILRPSARTGDGLIARVVDRGTRAPRDDASNRSVMVAPFTPCLGPRLMWVAASIRSPVVTGCGRAVSVTPGGTITAASSTEGYGRDDPARSRPFCADGSVPAARRPARERAARAGGPRPPAAFHR